MFYLNKFNQTMAGLFAPCVKVQCVIKVTHVFKGFLEKHLSVSHSQSRRAAGVGCEPLLQGAMGCAGVRWGARAACLQPCCVSISRWQQPPGAPRKLRAGDLISQALVLLLGTPPHHTTLQGPGAAFWVPRGEGGCRG